MRVPAHSPAAFQWFRRGDVGDMFYGAIVSGASLGALSAHAEDSTRVAVATSVVLVVYWLAHVYIHALAQQVSEGDTRHLILRLGTSARDEVRVLLGGVPAVVVYIAAAVAGAEQETAAWIALSVLMVLLVTASYWGARHAGLSRAAACVEAAGAAVIGLLIMVMKALLH